MTTEAEQIDPGFSTADAEQVELSFAAGQLILRFLDWQEKKHTVRFVDVTAYSWRPEDAVQAPDQRNDVVYRLNKSDWRSALASEQENHFRFWFNACGVLDVLCTSFERAE